MLGGALGFGLIGSALSLTAITVLNDPATLSRVGPTGPTGSSIFGPSSTITGPTGASTTTGPMGFTGADSTVTGPTGRLGPVGATGSAYFSSVIGFQVRLPPQPLLAAALTPTRFIVSNGTVPGLDSSGNYTIPVTGYYEFVLLIGTTTGGGAATNCVYINVPNEGSGTSYISAAPDGSGNLSNYVDGGPVHFTAGQIASLSYFRSASGQTDITNVTGQYSGTFLRPP